MSDEIKVSVIRYPDRDNLVLRYVDRRQINTTMKFYVHAEADDVARTCGPHSSAPKVTMAVTWSRKRTQKRDKTKTPKG